MRRREFHALGLGAVLAATAPATRRVAAQSQPSPAPVAAGPKLQIAMLVHPDMILLDQVAPQTIFSLLMADVHLVWKDRQPVPTDVGVVVTPTTTFADCPQDLDVLFVPGGLKGSVAAMDDAAVTGFLAERGRSARYVTSVCTGALVLGAAGLLRGHSATSHWYVRDLLPLMGATVGAGRVVVDRNRITGGGVTAGLDFGLRLAALLRGEDYACHIQLVLEYDPKPPFDAGSPESAGASLADDVLKRRAPVLTAARQATARARQRLGT